jgi:hypothetical protein
MNWVLSSCRRFRLLLLGGLVLGFAVGCTTTAARKKAEKPRFNFIRMKLSIGETNASVLVFQHRKPSPTFINVHDDENTSVEAGKAVIEETSGRLIELAHSGKRHLRFTIDGKSYAVDPNRIFSESGIRSTLERQGDYSPEAHQAVKQFALQLLERFALPKEPVIVALHNTVDGNYSIESYRPGAQHAAAASDLHISPNRSRYDFFYVTDRRFFNYLKARDFNVIFQDNSDVPDDGSLSVYFATKGIPYLNIEAQLGQLDRQIEMVRAARQMLDDLKLVR